MKHRPVQVVYGPGTFLNRAVAAVNLQVRAILASAQQQVKSAATAARQLALGRGLSKSQAKRAASAARALESQQQTTRIEQLYLQSGISGTPRIDDPQFIPQIVFDQTRGVNQPKARFAYLFPTARSALIQVRLKSTLSDAQQSQAIGWIRQAVQMPQFRSAYGGTYTVSGAPVVVEDLAAKLSGQVALLLAVAVAVMAVVLRLVFRARLRLLPLVIALLAAGITFGLLWLVGGTLTMAQVAVLPILIGLAVDYAIQFQSRFGEERSKGATTTVALGRAAAAGRPGDRDRRARDRHRIPRAAALAGADGARLRTAARGRRRRRVAVCAGDGRGRDGARRARWRGGPRSRARGRRDPHRARRHRVRLPRRRRPRRLTRGSAIAGDRASRRTRVLGAVLARPGRVLASPGPRRCSGGSPTPRPRSSRTSPSSCPATCRRFVTFAPSSGSLGVSGEIDVLVHAAQRRHPAGGRVDALARPSAADPLPLSGDPGLRRVAAVPGAVAPRPVRLGAAPAALRAAPPTQTQINALLGSVPTVLLPGRAQPRPSRRDARVRDPTDATLRAAAGDRLHPLPAASAGGGHRAADWAAGAGRRGRQRALLLAPAAADAAGRPAGGGGCPARGLQGAATRPRSAHADRAGDRVVGADPVPDRDPAEPDVGDPGRARHRDLDRVQRAALRALSPGAPRRGRAARGAGADAPPHRRRGAGVRASPRSPASPS